MDGGNTVRKSEVWWFCEPPPCSLVTSGPSVWQRAEGAQTTWCRGIRMALTNLEEKMSQVAPWGAGGAGAGDADGSTGSVAWFPHLLPPFCRARFKVNPG